MIGVIVILAVVACASAQQYACSQDYCTSQGYQRVDVLGCQYFCYLDTLPPTGFLTLDEFNVAFDDWRGAAPVCDEACYVNAHHEIVPGACDNELTAAYRTLAALDSDPSSVSSADIVAWYNQIHSLDPAADNITADTFQTYWHVLYASIGDPNCVPTF